MHVNHSLNTNYILTEDGIDHKIALITEEKGLGVWITSDMKPNKQCRRAADKTMVTVRMTKRNFKYTTHTHTHTTVLRLCGNCPGQPG